MPLLLPIFLTGTHLFCIHLVDMCTFRRATNPSQPPRMAGTAACRVMSTHPLCCIYFVCHAQHPHGACLSNTVTLSSWLGKKS